MTQASAAIVAGGTHFARGTQWGVGAAWASSGVVPVTMGGATSSVQQNELARMLDLPAPRPPSTVIGCLGTILLVGGLAIGGLIALLVYLDSTGGSAGATGGPDALAVAVFGFLFTGGPLLAIGGVLTGGARGARRRWRREIAMWQNAAPIAGRLVYCARDHVVYDPVNAGEWFHPAQSRAYAIDLATAERQRQF